MFLSHLAFTNDVVKNQSAAMRSNPGRVNGNHFGFKSLDVPCRSLKLRIECDHHLGNPRGKTLKRAWYSAPCFGIFEKNSKRSEVDLLIILLWVYETCCGATDFHYLRKKQCLMPTDRTIRERERKTTDLQKKTSIKVSRLRFSNRTSDGESVTDRRFDRTGIFETCLVFIQ